MYVFNCGSLDISDPERFRFKKEELATTNLSVACFLIVHPKGTLMWDVGAVPDSALKPGEKSALEGYATITETLKSQMEKIGYEPSDIEYLAFSHYHYDHIANANQFAERDVAGAQSGARRDVCAKASGQGESGELFARSKIARPSSFQPTITMSSAMERW